MKCAYRGVEFEATTETISPSPLGLTGVYRGHQVSFSSALPKPVNSAVALHYRGVSYLR